MGTANLSENEISDVISGMEAAMEEEFALTGNLEEGTRLEISFEEAGITLEIASQETGTIVMETAMVQETFSSVLEEKPMEVLKEEIVSMVQEETTFQQILVYQIALTYIFMTVVLVLLVIQLMVVMIVL